MNRTLRRALSCGALLLGAAPAYATPNFPPSMGKTLSISEPACTVCHQTSAGGSGTVGQPFGQALMERGLSAYDTASLGTALQALESEGVDSDGDGAPDITELREGRNPNRADGAQTGGAPSGNQTSPEPIREGEETVGPPEYGCSTGSLLEPRALILLVLAAARRAGRRKARK